MTRDPLSAPHWTLTSTFTKRYCFLFCIFCLNCDCTVSSFTLHYLCNFCCCLCNWFFFFVFSFLFATVLSVCWRAAFKHLYKHITITRKLSLFLICVHMQPLLPPQPLSQKVTFYVSVRFISFRFVVFLCCRCLFLWNFVKLAQLCKVVRLSWMLLEVWNFLENSRCSNWMTKRT